MRGVRSPLGAFIAAALVMVGGAGGLLLPVTADRASALTNCTVSGDSLDSQETAFLTLINNYRAANGRPALKVSPNLNRASTWLAQDMGSKAYFSHTDSLGRSPSTRAQNCGYASGAGENIAAGTVWDTAEEAFDAWRNSSGHNANMLNGSYRVIGIARVQVPGSPYNWYWVTNFGTYDDSGSSTPSPTASPSATTTPQPSTPTPTATATPTQTATPTATSRRRSGSAPTPTATASATATPSATATASPTPLRRWFR
ncbi:MAG: CAP domain-containing protein [Dehalococcoidia bacterium]